MWPAKWKPNFCIERFHIHGNGWWRSEHTHSGHIYKQEVYDIDLSMAGDLWLSDYASELSIFNKRRYFKKISEI